MMQSDSGFTLLSYVTPRSSGSGIALVAMLSLFRLCHEANQGELSH
jgi:hypothetical protein